MHLVDLRSPQIGALSRDVPFVFPIAALEQHGPHLPLFTDSLLCAEVTRRAAESLGDRLLFAPLLWLGNSHHHMDFPGTLSAAPRVYLDLLASLIDDAVHHGFRRIVLFNGHGGNTVPGSQAVFEARQRYRERRDLLLLSATYWMLGAEPWKEALPAGQQFLQRRMGHACEWETSMILRIAPRLVGEFQRLEPVLFGEAFESADRAWVTQDRSTPGYIGDPRHATAEKGEALLRSFARSAVAFLDRVAAWDGSTWA